MAIADGYRALSDPTRRRILQLLRDDDLAAGEIAAHFDMSWPSVSRHLSILQAAGLTTAVRQGQKVVYSLTTSVLQDIATELAELARWRSDQPPTKGPSAPKRSKERTKG